MNSWLPRAVAVPCLFAVVGLAPACEASSPALEPAVAEGIRHELTPWVFAAPEALVREELAGGEPLDLVVLSRELGLRLDSFPTYCPGGCNLDPPVPALSRIRDVEYSSEGPVTVVVTYVSFGPPEGENMTAGIYELFFRQEGGDWLLLGAEETGHH